MPERKKTTTDLRERVAKLQSADEERRKAEEALRVSESFSSSLLANSPNPIVVINPDTSIRYINPALVELTGFSADEVVGVSAPYPWWPEDRRDEIAMRLEEAMETGVRNVEAPFVRKDGGTFWVEMSVSPIMSGDDPKYYVSSWVDITRHKRFEEELAGYRGRLLKVAWLMLGDREDAVQFLQLALDDGDDHTPILPREMNFEGLWNYPPFQDLFRYFP